MARHNRDGRGSDQRGQAYDVSYQPDWLWQIKVTRALESGRQSTKILFRNPEERRERPGRSVRTRVSSGAQGLDFEIVANDPKRVIRRIVVETVAPGGVEPGSTVIFSMDGGPESD